MKSNILAASIIIGVYCQEGISVTSEVITWKEIFAIVGIVLIVIAIIKYYRRNRDIHRRQFLRQYVVPSQTQGPFISIKNDNQFQTQPDTDPPQTHSQSPKQQPQSEPSYFQKDEQLSIDQGDQNPTKDLSKMFDTQEQISKKKKKSKSRKRLANTAKLQSNTPRDNDNRDVEDN